jgi:hypothetical protein
VIQGRHLTGIMRKKEDMVHFEKWNDNGLKVLMLCKYSSKYSMDLAKGF